MERVMIFIDGSNLYHGLKGCMGNTHLDFEKFITKLCGNDRSLVRTYYYNVRVIQEDDEEKYRKQQRFFERLNDIAYFTPRLGRLEKRGPTVVEKGIDVKISVDMLTHAFRDTYDTAILVSGDGDFAEIVEAVKDLGKHVEVAYFPQARALRQACDKFIELTNKYLKDCFL